MSLFDERKIQRWEMLIHKDEQILLTNGKGTTFLHNCISKVDGAKVILTIRRATKADLLKEKQSNARIKKSGDKFIKRVKHDAHIKC